MTRQPNRLVGILAKTQDLARDLESHLGLAARSREWNPTFSTASEFHAQRPDGQDVVREAEMRRLLREYGDQADQALFAVRKALSDSSLSPDEVTAHVAVVDLVAAIHNVRSHDEAVALVATL